MPRGARQRRCAWRKACSDVWRCLADSWVLLSPEPRLQLTHTAFVPDGESRSGARAARAGSTHRPGSDGRCSRGSTGRFPWRGHSWRCSHTLDRSPGSPDPSGRQGRLEHGQRERTHGISIAAEDEGRVCVHLRAPRKTQTFLWQTLAASKDNVAERALQTWVSPGQICSALTPAVSV